MLLVFFLGGVPLKFVPLLSTYFNSFCVFCSDVSLCVAQKRTFLKFSRILILFCARSTHNPLSPPHAIAIILQRPTSQQAAVWSQFPSPLAQRRLWNGRLSRGMGAHVCHCT
jgi:hypothetical protein